MAAAGTCTLILSDAMQKASVEFWEITTDGNSTAVIYTSLNQVIGISWAWGEDIGGTPTEPEFVIDNTAKTVTVTTANTTNIDKLCFVTLFGFR